jgi:hypothetical protein
MSCIQTKEMDNKPVCLIIFVIIVSLLSKLTGSYVIRHGRRNLNHVLHLYAQVCSCISFSCQHFIILTQR